MLCHGVRHECLCLSSFFISFDQMTMNNFFLLLITLSLAPVLPRPRPLGGVQRREAGAGRRESSHLWFPPPGFSPKPSLLQESFLAPPLRTALLFHRRQLLPYVSCNIPHNRSPSRSLTELYFILLEVVGVIVSLALQVAQATIRNKNEK